MTVVEVATLDIGGWMRSARGNALVPLGVTKLSVSSLSSLMLSSPSLDIVF